MPHDLLLHRVVLLQLHQNPFLSRVVWKSLLVLYARDVLTDLVTIHHEQPRWQYCTQVSSMLFGEALSRLFLGSMTPTDRHNIANEVNNVFSLQY